MIAESMKIDNNEISVSEAGITFSVPCFPTKVFTEELGDDDDDFFMKLPNELKFLILDSVSGVDIAKVSCVCSELRNLASTDDLWKQKYVSQFRNYKDSGSDKSSFKERFVKAWKGQTSVIMRMNRYNPFGGDLGGDDDDREWLNIVRLCLPQRVIGVSPTTLRNGMLMSNCNQDSK